MSDLSAELRRLAKEVQEMARRVSPWIDVKEMETRYNVCSKTLLAMERRGEIPKRINGRWNRADVMQHEEAVRA